MRSLFFSQKSIMSPKKEKKPKGPDSDSKDKCLKILDEIMAELVVIDADSMDKAFITKAMLKFEEVGEELKGKADEEITDFINLIAKIYEEFMMDGIPLTNDTIGLSNDCAGLIKEFLESSLSESQLKADLETLGKRLKSALKMEDAPEVSSGKGTETGKKETVEGETSAVKKEFFGTYELPIHSEEDSVMYDEFISETLEHVDSIENGIMELEKNPTDSELLNSIFRHFHSVKGAAGFLGILDVNKISHETENLLDLARKGKLYPDKTIVNLLLKSVDYQVRLMRHLDSRIKHMLGKISEDMMEPFLDISSILEELRATIQRAKEHPTAFPPEGPPGVEKVAGITAPAEKLEPSVGKTIATSAIKVSTEKLDALLELVGELVISHTLVSQDPVLQNEININILKNLSYMGKSTKSLQEQVMAVRMVPLRMMFQKMARLVRDLSDKTSKKITFEISGEETEIDKTVIDELNDPLVHLLRNSVDHGIEPPDERKATGKSETGQVTLKAYNQGGNAVIDIIDDGRGLNSERIRKKAIEKNLIKEEDNLTEREISNLILLPGFSTAAKTTDISGRGVGMDVVARNINKLNGKLEINSKNGKGSVFTIRLPLTMAIIDGMLVRVGKEKYIIPVVSIRESIQPSKKDITTVSTGAEVISVRDKLVPLIRLNRVFDVPESKNNPWEALVMIVEANGKISGLMVDNLIGQQQVVIKNLGTALQGVKGVSGGAILGDGRVGLILDIEGIVKSL